MPADFMAGALAGIGDRIHQKNLLDLQNRVSGNQLMAQHLLKLSEDQTLLPEARQRALEGGMEIYSDPSKEHRKTIGNALGDIAHIHVEKGSPGWMGGQTENPVEAQNMPISTQLAPPPGPPPETGTHPGISPDMQSFADVHPNPNAPVTPPPTPPPGTTTTPPPSTFTGQMPGPTAGYTRSGRYTPEEMAQMGARAEGLKEEAKVKAQFPAKMQEITAAAELRNIQYQLKTEAELAKLGYKLQPDAMGNPHAVKMDPSEFSQVTESVIEKNQAANRLAKARETAANADAEYKKGLLDPTSPMNMEKLFRMDMTRQRVSMQRERLGMQELGVHARYYGTDLDGKPLPGAIYDPDLGTYVGTAFQSYYAPTAQTRTRGQAADPVVSMGNALISFANNPENEDLFGKVNGRWSDWEQAVGTNDPRKPELKAMIESFAALIAVNHGWRSSEAPQKFVELMNNKASSKAFGGGVYALIDAAQKIKQTAKPTRPPGTPQAPPGGGSEPQEVIRDPKTGKLRYK